MKKGTEIPEAEKIELERFIKGRIAEAGESTKSTVEKMNVQYPDRTEYYATTAQQIKAGNMPLWKIVRLADAIGYKLKWEKKDTHI